MSLLELFLSSVFLSDDSDEVGSSIGGVWSFIATRLAPYSIPRAIKTKRTPQITKTNVDPFFLPLNPINCSTPLTYLGKSFVIIHQNNNYCN